MSSSGMPAGIGAEAVTAFENAGQIVLHRVAVTNRQPAMEVQGAQLHEWIGQGSPQRVDDLG
jgi:hypothetical protein